MAQTSENLIPTASGQNLGNANQLWNLHGQNVTAKNMGEVRFAGQFDGATAGERIIAALADLPSTGGTVDARAFEGAQTIPSTITISKPARVLFGAATFTFTGSTRIFSLSSEGSAIEGLSAAGTVFIAPAGVDGVNPEADNVALRNLTLRGPNQLSAGFIGIDFGGRTGVIVENVICEQWGGHGANTGGASSFCKFINCTFRENFNDGILIGEGGHDIELHNCDYLDNIGIGLDINGYSNRAIGGRCRGNGGAGGPVDAAGCYVQSSAGSVANHNIFIGVDFSDNAGPGATVRSESGTESNYNIFIGCISNNNSGSSSNGDGFNVDTSTLGDKNRNKFIGCIANNNQRWGFVVGGGAGVAEDNEFLHCTAFDNGTDDIADSGDRTRIVGNLQVGSGSDDSYFIKNFLQVLGSGISIGTDPAQLGVLRIPNNNYLYSRNAANDGNLLVLGADGSNQIIIRGGGGTKSILIQSSNGTERMSMSEAGAFTPGATGQALGAAGTQWRVYNQVIATASLPAADAAMDGVIIIEDAGAGDRNLILYAGGQRFRIDGGAAV